MKDLHANTHSDSSSSTRTSSVVSSSGTDLWAARSDSVASAKSVSSSSAVVGAYEDPHIRLPSWMTGTRAIWGVVAGGAAIVSAIAAVLAL